jgi:hypothetical protein
LAFGALVLRLRDALCELDSLADPCAQIVDRLLGVFVLGGRCPDSQVAPDLT